MRDQWFYTGWVPPKKRSRERVAVRAPCIVLLAAGDVAPHGQEMMLASALSLATFGEPPTPPPDRPREAQKVATGLGERALGDRWSMEKLFNQWYKLDGDLYAGPMRCPICLNFMSRLAEGGQPSWTASRGKRWTTVDHIIHLKHEECYWCVWPMCNECNSSKGIRNLKEWLSDRLDAVAHDGKDDLREAVREARQTILKRAPAGHIEPHDCENPAPIRQSYGCAIGQHEWVKKVVVTKVAGLGDVEQYRPVWRCSRSHCDEGGNRIPRQREVKWRCKRCGKASSKDSIDAHCLQGSCKTEAN